MDKTTPVLIAAATGRALAASARRAGYAPLVADFFADQDTLAAAEAHVRLACGLARGIDADELIAALEILAAARNPMGIVCGTGFEDRPDILGRIGKRWRLLGNQAETVARIKDPVAFAKACRDCGIPHPDVSASRPADTTGWLAKRRGGAGGAHIQAARARGSDAPDYYQRHVAGAAVSALLLAAGRRAKILGFSAQWTSPQRDQPYLYGGAVRPAALARETADALVDAVERLLARVPLVGLNSADFLVDGGRFWLLEVNPRPGATLDLFEPRDRSLFALHVAACEGTLPASAPYFDDAKASAIVYAERDLLAPPLDWPDWSADRPRAGTAIKAGEPLCTVFASASSATTAKQLVHQRVDAILAQTHASAA